MKKAKQKLAEIKKLLSQGYTAGATPAANIGLDPQRATVLDAVQLVERNKTLAGRTGEDYARLRRRLLEPAHAGFASLPLRLVQPGHALAFMEKLRDVRLIQNPTTATVTRYRPCSTIC